MSKRILSVVPVAVLSIGLLTGCSGNGIDVTPNHSTAISTPTDNAAEVSQAPYTESTEAPAPEDTPEETLDPYTPTTSDFKVSLKTLSQECFGSAGCNVTVRPSVTYTGQPLQAGMQAEVTYEIRGGDDGSQTNTFTMDSDGKAMLDESFISTSSHKTKLSIAVTEVEVMNDPYSFD